MYKTITSISISLVIGLSGCSTQSLQTFAEIMKGIGESGAQAQSAMNSVDGALQGSKPKSMTCYPQPNG